MRSMRSTRNFGVFVAGGILLAGCGSSLWPSLTGDDPAAGSQSRERLEIPASQAERAAQQTQQQVQQGAAAARSAAAPLASQPAIEPRPLATQPQITGKPTGTFVGKKVDAMRQDLNKLRSAVNRLDNRMVQIRGDNTDATQRYLGTVAAMNSKLQVGTTPGNPLLVQQWNEAQKQLKRIEANISRMNSLSNDAGAEASVAGYLLDSVRATFTLSGAVDEDHVQLRALEDGVNQTVVGIDRLLNELSDDLNRQTGYLGSERRNLTAMSIAIKNGERYGMSLVNRAFAQAEVKASRAARAPLSRNARPLVVIRFDRPNVEYQLALYNAVSKALERKPNAAFDLVAVHPKTGSPAQIVLNSTAARRNAENVMRTLAEQGLPTSRVGMNSMSSATVQANEVRVYVR